MKFKPREWSPSEIEQLKEAVKTQTWTEIAAQFHCSERAVRDKANALGIRKYILNKASSSLDFRIHEYSETHGIKQAAKRFKKTIDAIKSARRRIADKRKFINKSFSSSERHRKFRLSCYRWARRYGFSHEAEEFASIAMIQTLEGRNTTIQNLAKDYLSRKWKSYNGRAESNAISLEAAKNVEAPVSEPELDLFAIADKLSLTGTKRAVFLMYFKSAMTHLEIGRYFGLTESWSSYITVEILEKISASHVNGKTKAGLREEAQE